MSACRVRPDDLEPSSGIYGSLTGIYGASKCHATPAWRGWEFRPWRAIKNSFTRRYSRPELVWQIADILSGNSARTAFGLNSALRFDYPVAARQERAPILR